MNFVIRAILIVGIVWIVPLVLNGVKYFDIKKEKYKGIIKLSSGFFFIGIIFQVCSVIIIPVNIFVVDVSEQNGGFVIASILFLLGGFLLVIYHGWKIEYTENNMIITRLFKKTRVQFKDIILSVEDNYVVIFSKGNNMEYYIGLSLLNVDALLGNINLYHKTNVVKNNSSFHALKYDVNIFYFGIFFFILSLVNLFLYILFFDVYLEGERVMLLIPIILFLFSLILSFILIMLRKNWKIYFNDDIVHFYSMLGKTRSFNLIDLTFSNTHQGYKIYFSKRFITYINKYKVINSILVEKYIKHN
ncbi:MAG: hypothetical protein KQ78_01555 [Candidatus Izimaplasma bacterium HR2]|nr:MAG: hypothetical protein KQ78_01555 [Candidatus Izimaplasma bacterium HR2]